MSRSKRRRLASDIYVEGFGWVDINQGSIKPNERGEGVEGKMTVNEVIAILSEFDGGMPVLVDGYEDGLHDLVAKNIKEIRYVEGFCQKSYRGPHDRDSHGEKVGLLLGRAE